MSFDDITKAAMDQIFSSFGESEPVVYMPARSAPLTIRGMFSEISQEVQPHGAIVSTTNPNLLVSLSDFGERPSQKDKVKIRSEIYTVKEVHLDGYGNALLELYKS